MVDSVEAVGTGALPEVVEAALFSEFEKIDLLELTTGVLETEVLELMALEALDSAAELTVELLEEAGVLATLGVGVLVTLELLASVGVVVSAELEEEVSEISEALVVLEEVVSSPKSSQLKVAWSSV